MAHGRPSTVTGEQGKGLWRRYKSGESILGIARALGQRRAATRTPMGFCGSTILREWICRASAKPNWILWPGS
jgi:hypothetical protein